eukprot:CAMPEP_0178413302 /NCGR_PEP_ID=MMETSP0689_2-20121128/22458_1 /TAXON_ID=160604 /ORGANISM="Amphidinium massartii, Strain CS-259" /LENGTH=257 /DNA_ID=CAMNT_0020034571 /DNA_START=139 /DNA_END=912 /DNA_ORIENTATION=+
MVLSYDKKGHIVASLRDVRRHSHQAEETSTTPQLDPHQAELMRDIEQSTDNFKRLEKQQRDETPPLNEDGLKKVEKLESDLESGDLDTAINDAPDLETAITDDVDRSKPLAVEPSEDTTSTTQKALDMNVEDEVEARETSSTTPESGVVEVSGKTPPEWPACKGCKQMEAFATAKTVFENLLGWKEETIAQGEASKTKNEAYGEAYAKADATLEKIDNETEMKDHFNSDQQLAAGHLIGKKDELTMSFSDLNSTVEN